MAETGTTVTGERRLLTVVFCDLVDSTVLSERLDPEDYAELLLGYQETGRRIVEQHGGTIAQFAGDGLVISFGYPIAHEHDAERAVAAALAIVEALAREPRLGVELQCRIGIHSGVSVVGRMRSGDNTDLSLFGPTANIAARAKAEATIGEIVVTDAVVDLLRGEFVVGDRRTVTLRGVDGPTGLWTVSGRAPTASDGANPAMVGRTEQRAALVDRWRAAGTGGGSAVVVSGPPGIGKSTLVADTRRELAIDDCFEIRARELTQLTPFHQLGELAARVMANDDKDVSHAAATVIDAVEATADDRHGSAEQAWHLVIEASRKLGRALGARRRLLVVEDVHWLDSSSRAAIEALAGELNGSMTLLVATARPPATLGDAERIDIDPLGDAEVETLARSVAGATATAETIAAIVARAGGIPFYAAELAGMATSLTDAAMPDSLQASLLARLDRTPELTRPAQVASVLGDELDADLLAAALDVEPTEAEAVLTALAEHGLVIDSSTGPPTFTHALLREAIYSSLLRRDRRRLHQRVADALTADGAGDDERLALVGHHLQHAARPFDAARYFSAAARRSARRGAFAEALTLAERGLDLCGESDDYPDVTLDLTMTRGNARLAVEGYAAPGLAELWTDAEQLAIRAGNQLERSSAMNGQSVAALFDGDYPRAIERAERIRRFGAARDDRAALVRAHCSLALPQLFAGDITAALTNARRAMDLYQDGDHRILTYGFGTDHGVIAASAAGMAAWLAGAGDADELLESAIALAERIESPISLALALHHAATIDVAAGRYELASNRAARAEGVAERFGLTFYLELCRLVRSAAIAHLGDRGASELADQALDMLVSRPGTMGTTLGLLQLAICQEGAGRRDAAAATAQYGLEIATSAGERIFEVELTEIAARCASDDDAWAALDRAATAAEARGAGGSAARARAALSSR